MTDQGVKGGAGRRKKNDLKLPQEKVQNGKTLAESLHEPGQPPDISADVEWISPEQAREWLATMHYDRQRDRYDPHLSDLRYAIRQGHYSAQGIILCQIDGEWRLTNGQHRLQAIADEERGVFEVVIRKRGLTEETGADEYSRTDRGKRRQVGDALRAHQTGQEYGLTQAQVTKLSGAVALIEAGFGYTKPKIRSDKHLNDQDARVEAVRGWLPEAAKYFKLITGARKGRHQHLVLAATFAVALETLRHVGDKAEEFWREVATSPGGVPDDPVQQLLITFSNRPQERTKAPVFARLVARCWKAYYEGESISRIRTPRSDEPIEIAGTPWKGKLTSSLLNPQIEG